MPITAEDILDNITRYGIEFYRVYPGIYRGIVEANDDPQKQGRVKVHVPTMQEHAPNIWVKAAMQGSGDGRGVFWPPEVGDPVYVSFAQGQPSRPECYFGGWYGRRDNTSDVPEDLGYSGDHPDIRGMVTRMGHKLIFSDAPGDERVEVHWNKANAEDAAKQDRTKTAGEGDNTQGGGKASLKFTPDGSIEITDNANPNQTIKMNATQGTIEVADKSGNKVVLSSAGARIESPSIDLGGSATSPSTEPGVKGTAWFRWAVAHTHPTSMGPSGVAVPPPTPDILSTVMRMK